MKRENNQEVNWNIYLISRLETFFKKNLKNNIDNDLFQIAATYSSLMKKHKHFFVALQGMLQR
jgi:hypothetical protein